MSLLTNYTNEQFSVSISQLRMGHGSNVKFEGTILNWPKPRHILTKLEKPTHNHSNFRLLLAGMQCFSFCCPVCAHENIHRRYVNQHIGILY